MQNDALSPMPNPPITIQGHDPRYMRTYDIDVLYYNPETYLITNKPWDLRIDGDTESCPTEESLLYKQFPQHPKLHLLHQLDYVTSGVHCWGLNRKAAGLAGKLFVARTLTKTYAAIVRGHMTKQGKFAIYTPLIDKSVPSNRNGVCVAEGSEGKPCETHVEVLKTGYFHTLPVTLVMLTPHTGRRHQLRVHMLSIGHPIIGDPAYDPRTLDDPTAFRTMLHAWKIEMPFKEETLRVEAAHPFEEYVAEQPGVRADLPLRMPLLVPLEPVLLAKQEGDAAVIVKA
ncbi:pseudouridine synthase [Fimicolochytrium jonesii]|uniref:pseudouridine synthase n=1 Tax=Fimicolochytrium jonesii TaxID=1396493 RepID=UPI0022FE16A2|nr:pseudouridine synthase [Fimicolochytrium jonesii]KAI8825194.1 pseudouridine synthase [Fimicolochytrium jonesii]